MSPAPDAHGARLRLRSRVPDDAVRHSSHLNFAERLMAAKMRKPGMGHHVVFGAQAIRDGLPLAAHEISQTSTSSKVQPAPAEEGAYRP